MRRRNRAIHVDDAGRDRGIAGDLLEVPRAGETMRPATPCSIIDFSTSSWRTGFSAVLAMKGTTL